MQFYLFLNAIFKKGYLSENDLLQLSSIRIGFGPCDGLVFSLGTVDVACVKSQSLWAPVCW